MEMTSETITNYFEKIREVSSQDNVFCCVNRVQKGNAFFSLYPWHKKDMDYIYNVFSLLPNPQMIRVCKLYNFFDKK